MPVEGHKTNKQLVIHGDYSSIANCRANAPAMGYMEFFAPLQNLYLYIPRCSKGPYVSAKFSSEKSGSEIRDRISALYETRHFYNNPVKNPIPNQKTPVHTPYPPS